MFAPTVKRGSGSFVSESVLTEQGVPAPCRAGSAAGPVISPTALPRPGAGYMYRGCWWFVLVGGVAVLTNFSFGRCDVEGRQLIVNSSVPGAEYTVRRPPYPTRIFAYVCTVYGERGYLSFP